MKNKQLLAVSFSGGRTSAFMARFIQLHPAFDKYDKVFTFANTSKELPETIDFIKKCDQAFGLNLVKLEAEISLKKGVGTAFKVVDYKDLKMDGSLFEKAIQKRGLPTFMASSCTQQLKAVPQDKYIQSLGYKYVTKAIGIRADEAHRATKNMRDNGIIFPLIDVVSVDKHFINSYWDRQPFNLELKSHQGNCDFCFKKSLRKRLTLLKENPQIADWWAKMEGKYGNQVIDKFDIRGKKTINEIVALAKDFENPFSEVYRKKEGTKAIKALNLDLESNCFCESSI